MQNYYTQRLIILFLLKSHIIKQRKRHFMKITDVRIRKTKSESKMKAIVSITFDNEFVVHDIKIIDSQNGLD